MPVEWLGSDVIPDRRDNAASHREIRLPSRAVAANEYSLHEETRLNASAGRNKSGPAARRSTSP